jgi:hypothetical protein
VDSGGVVQGTNNFTVDNYFLNKNIYVSTMETGCDDTHAASCEFVKNALYGVFDIFETKFMDYQLPQSSPWKLQGSTLGSDTRAYRVISEEVRSSNTTKDTYDINGTTYNINYCRTSNGHKVVIDPGNFNVVNTVYGIIGAGWYYYLYGGGLTLPRTKCYFRPTSDILEAGNYFRPVVPQHTHSYSVGRSADAGHGSGKNMHHGGDNTCSTFKNSTGEVNNNNPFYTNDNTVRPPSVGMLLYFFCG